MPEKKAALIGENKPLQVWILLITLGAVILIRMLLTALPSFAIDMGGYRSWSLSLAKEGFAGFYDKYHVVYGPGYMYLLWLVGKIVTLFNLNYSALEYLIKTVSVISDLAGAFMIYLIGKKMNKEKLGLVVAAAYALNPAVFFNSSVWGQFDSLTATLLLVMCYFFLRKLDVIAVIVFTASVLTKPQSVFLLPIPAVLYFKNNPGLLEFKWEGIKRLPLLARTVRVVPHYLKNFNWFKFGIAAVAVIVTYISMAMPFADGKPVWWFFEHSLKSAQDYPYATANAFNLWTLLGGQCINDSQPFFYLTYAGWANILVAGIFVLSFIGIIKHKVNAFVTYYSAYFIYLSVFLVWTKMHERYMLPALIFGMICILWDARLAVPVGLASICHFGNMYAIYIRTNETIWVPQWDPMAMIIAGLSIVVLIYSTYYYIRNIIKPKKLDKKFQI
ncbi:MAG: hypothetical protein JW969_18495 [Spirochaetales bacterium]|nr:hypothetical protein [Spirochaetales bacterium]